MLVVEPCYIFLVRALSPCYPSDSLRTDAGKERQRRAACCCRCCRCCRCSRCHCSYYSSVNRLGVEALRVQREEDAQTTGRHDGVGGRIQGVSCPSMALLRLNDPYADRPLSASAARLWASLFSSFGTSHILIHRAFLLLPLRPKALMSLSASRMRLAASLPLSLLSSNQ